MRMIRVITSCVSKPWNVQGSLVCTRRLDEPGPSDDFSHPLTNFIPRAPLVAIAVGCDVFRPDARTLIDALIHIQSRTCFHMFPLT